MCELGHKINTFLERCSIRCVEELGNKINTFRERCSIYVLSKGIR